MDEKAKIPSEFVCIKTSYIKNKGCMKISCLKCPNQDMVGCIYTKHTLISKAYFNRVIEMCSECFHITTRTQKHSNCGDCCNLDLSQNIEIRARVMNGECMQVTSQWMGNERLVKFRKLSLTFGQKENLFYIKPQLKPSKSPPIQKTSTIKPDRKRVYSNPESKPKRACKSDQLLTATKNDAYATTLSVDNDEIHETWAKLSTTNKMTRKPSPHISTMIPLVNIQKDSGLPASSSTTTIQPMVSNTIIPIVNSREGFRTLTSSTATITSDSLAPSCISTTNNMRENSLPYADAMIHIDNTQQRFEALTSSTTTTTIQLETSNSELYNFDIDSFIESIPTTDMIMMDQSSLPTLSDVTAPQPGSSNAFADLDCWF